MRDPLLEPEDAESLAEAFDRLYGMAARAAFDQETRVAP
jgi:hypothetical protein